MSFSTEFAAARKAGKKEFTFKGKKYHTRTKEEKPKAAAPKTSLRPKARPAAKKEPIKVKPRPLPARVAKDAPQTSLRPKARPSVKVTSAGPTTRSKASPSETSSAGFFSALKKKAEAKLKELEEKKKKAEAKLKELEAKKKKKESEKKRKPASSNKAPRANYGKPGKRSGF
jgi:hypothetical protein